MKAMKIISFLTATFCAISALLITSCNPDEPAPTVKVYGKVMLIHAAAGAPAIDLFIDGIKKNTDPIAYKNNSSYKDVEAGALNHQIISKYSSTGAKLDSVGLKVNKDIGYSYYTYIDNDANKTVRVFTSTDNLAATTAGKAKVRLVHLMPDIPGNIAIDVEAVAPGGIASSRNDFTNVTFKTIKDFVEIAKGTYDIKIKQTGTTNIVLTIPNVVLTEGKIYTFIAHGFATKLNTDPSGPTVTVINNN